MFPLVGAALIIFVPKALHDTIRGVALLISVVTMLLSFWVYVMFDPVASGMQLVVNVPWVASMGIDFHMGIDGISLLLIVLTTILSVICILFSWKSPSNGVKGFFISMLVLEAGMIGVFCALDLFLFYVFWEVMLVPMYFLIGVWGGPRKIYAAIKFVLFTMLGSLLMLVALLWLYFEYYSFAGEYSFDLLKMMDMPFPVRLWKSI